MASNENHGFAEGKIEFIEEALALSSEEKQDIEFRLEVELPKDNPVHEFATEGWMNMSTSARVKKGWHGRTPFGEEWFTVELWRQQEVTDAWVWIGTCLVYMINGGLTRVTFERGAFKPEWLL